MYKAMAERYSIGPGEVSRMTYAQIDCYLGEKKTMSADEIDAYMENYNGV